MGASISVVSDGKGNVTFGNTPLKDKEFHPLDDDCRFGRLDGEFRDDHQKYRSTMVFVFDDDGPRVGICVDRPGHYNLTRERAYARGGPDSPFN